MNTYTVSFFGHRFIEEPLLIEKRLEIGLSEMLFDYKIRTGKAVSRNAINLLKLMGFDDEIVSGAHDRANSYVQKGTWS